MDADMLVTLGRGLTVQLQKAWNARPGVGRFHDLELVPDADLCEIVSDHCRDIGRPLLLALREVPRMAECLAAARRRGKRIVTLMTDLAAEARDAHVGIDNVAAGRTAAFLVGQLLGQASVGLLLGNSRIRSHIDREIGFRTGLRMVARGLGPIVEAVGGSSSITTRQAVEGMLATMPTLGALYTIGPGSAGVVEAIRRSGRPVMVIGHEVNAVTAPLIADGEIHFALGCDPASLLDKALSILSGRHGMAEIEYLDFSIHTRMNLPGYSNLV